MSAVALIALLAGATLSAAPVSDRDAATTITSLVVAALATHKELAVVSSADVRRVVAFEADKQAMGCSDDGACLAEVADAMGARLVVFGDLGRLGSTLVLTLNLFDPKAGAAAGRVVVKAATLEDIGGKIDGAVDDLVREFLATSKEAGPARVIVLDVKATGGAVEEAPPDVAAGGGPAPIWLWTGVGLAGAGVVVGGVGAVLAALSLAANADAEKATQQTAAVAAYDQRDLYGISAYALWGAGAVALLAGGAVTGVAFVVGDE